MKNNRPISPHLTIYKPQFNSITSIMHRITGIALYFCITIIIWLYIISLYNEKNLYWNPAYTKYLLILPIFSFFYHLYSGIRHIIWSYGIGYTKSLIYKSSIAILLLSILTTLIIYLFIQ